MKKKKKHLRANTRNKPSNSLGESIRTLRIIYEETQEDLAAAINVSVSAIGNYELNLRIPDQDTLKSIAKHYDLSVESLTAGGFYNMSFEGAFEKANRHIEKIFPLACSKVALSNPLFSKGYNDQLETIKIISMSHEYTDSDSINEAANKLADYGCSCLETYSQIADDDTIPEVIQAAALINMLSLIIQFRSSLSFAQIEKEVLQYKAGDISAAKLLLSFYSINSKTTNLSEEDITENDIWELLKEVNRIPEWSELVYYYTALLHIYNQISVKSSFSSREFGIGQMYDLAKLGNKHAIEYFRAMVNILRH